MADNNKKYDGQDLIIFFKKNKNTMNRFKNK